jgi:hypothetical protein
VTSWSLTEDGAFTISGDVIAEWLPANARASTPGAAHLEVRARVSGLERPAGGATLSLVDVGCWIDGGCATIRDDNGGIDGALALDERKGRVGGEPGAHLEPALTIATALLLGRLGRALVHAAAVVAPGGGAWLLVGDTHAGKSTTTATLVQAGWGWMADDQVVLARSDDGVVVEGWARTPNLDAEYVNGGISGRRMPSSFRSPPVRGTRPLAGVLLSAIDADRPTELGAATGGDAFAALVRQSPWLLADRASAPAIIALLGRASSSGAYQLRSGRDSYARPEVLTRHLAPLLARGATSVPGAPDADSERWREPGQA